MSHEGERPTDARIQDQPERAPPHWLNPLGWAADSFASLSSFNAAARTRSEQVTGMGPGSPRWHTSKKIAQSSWSHLSPCAESRTISESSAILREPSRGASSPEASLRHMATISLPQGERYQGIFANGSAPCLSHNRRLAHSGAPPPFLQGMQIPPVLAAVAASISAPHCVQCTFGSLI
jgi:hypothetical protein